MVHETLKYEVRDHVGWLTLNRPEQHNALSWQAMLDLRDFFGSLEDDTPGFDGGWGADGGAPSRLRPRGFMIQRKLSDIPNRMRHAPQPIICAVRGAAVGGGFALALASDIRLAGETARFNIGAPRLGVGAGDVGMSYFLPRLIGVSRAALYMFTSRFIDAATAERIGLVVQVVPDDQLDEATEELAQELLKISPFSLRMTKEVLNANIDAGSLLDAVKLENRTQIMCGMTDDALEAVKATFLERRPPVYTDE